MPWPLGQHWLLEDSEQNVVCKYMGMAQGGIAVQFLFVFCNTIRKALIGLAFHDE